MNLKARSLFILLLVVTALICPPETSAQCAMCKQAAETSLSSDPTSMARSLNKGILYLMAVPYLAIAFIFRRQIYQLWKKLRARTTKTRAV